MKKMNQCENNSSEYPQYICGSCALENAGKWPKGHVATFHSDKCGWCEEICAVTAPHNWGYPIYKG